MITFRKLTTHLCLASMLSATPMLAHAENFSGFSSVLNADELRAELFGLAMEGVSGTTKNRWRECIAPDGETVYHLEGVEMHGRLNVTSAGLACFSYAHQDYDSPVCFKVSRSGDGYTFWGGSEGVYKTQNVVRGVEACPVDMPPIG